MSNDSKVKALLRETILTLCRASIDFKSELRIEGVIGITIDRDRVLLVSLHKTEKPRDTNFSFAYQEKSGDDGVVRLSALDPVILVAQASRRDKCATKQETAGSLSIQFNTSDEDAEDAAAEGYASMQLNDDDDDEQVANIKPNIDNENSSNSEGGQLRFTGDETIDSCGNDIEDNLICSVTSSGGETRSTMLSASKKSKSLRNDDKSGYHHRHKRSKTTAEQPGAQLPFVKRIEAIRLYEVMQSSFKVAQYLGVGETQIRSILSHKDELLAHAQRDANGLQFSLRKKSLPLLKRIEAIHLYEVLKSTKKVAKHFGVGPTQIRSILKRRQELLSIAGEQNEMNSVNS